MVMNTQIVSGYSMIMKVSVSWFYETYNKKYLSTCILTKYAGVIEGQMYGHEHTDSFRILYDNEVKCVPTVRRTLVY